MAKTINKNIEKKPKKKVFKEDTRIKVISNTIGLVSWKSNINNRVIRFNKIGAPAVMTFLELQDMAWSDKVFIQEGVVYIPDKEAFDALDLNIEWESIKPAKVIQKMLKEMGIEEIKDMVDKMPDSNKQLVADMAYQQFDDLNGSAINVIEETTKVKISTMKEDDKANKENKNKNK